MADDRGTGLIGESVTRLEDPPLLRGRGRFAADINFPHQLHMRLVRSPIAHGRLRAIRMDAARALRHKSWLKPLPPHLGMEIHELAQE